MYGHLVLDAIYKASQHHMKFNVMPTGFLCICGSVCGIVLRTIDLYETQYVLMSNDYS